MTLARPSALPTRWRVPATVATRGLVLQPGKGLWWEQWLVTAWLTSISFSFFGDGPLRYALAFVFIIAGIRYRREWLSTARRGPLVFALPALCVLSALWSGVPLHSIRFGALMLLSLGVCIYIASRLDRRQLMISFLIASTILCLLSLLDPSTRELGGARGVADLGVFAHKNVLGKRMLLLLVVGLAIALDTKFSRLRRALAMLTTLPAIHLIVRSNSTTAWLLAIGLGTLVVGLSLVWHPAGRIRGLRALIAAVAVSIAAASGLFVADVLRINPYQIVLEASGKDATLTGRTEIWAMGDQVVAQRPLLGAGAAGFWRPGVDEALILLHRFRVKDSYRFYFHNAYYEVAVHLGLVGLAIFLTTLSWALVVVIRDWLRRGDPTGAFLLGIAVYTLANSATESELFSALQLGPMMFWTAVFLSQVPDRTDRQAFRPARRYAWRSAFS